MTFFGFCITIAFEWSCNGLRHFELWASSGIGNQAQALFGLVKFSSRAYCAKFRVSYRPTKMYLVKPSQAWRNSLGILLYSGPGCWAKCSILCEPNFWAQASELKLEPVRALLSTELSKTAFCQTRTSFWRIDQQSKLLRWVCIVQLVTPLENGTLLWLKCKLLILRVSWMYILPTVSINVVVSQSLGDLIGETSPIHALSWGKEHCGREKWKMK